MLIGDLPIFVAHDSADVWANPELFYLDKHGQPMVVAGVPPDYFSETGQYWGNPLYRWDAHADDDYGWWAARLRFLLGRVDIVRFDHFRGFEAYWEIPAGSETAATGRWARGPGREFFQTIRKELGTLASPHIADTVRVLYGGSVNAKNIGDIVAQEDVDGALVGGASLDGEQFATLSAIAAGGPLP